MAFQELKDHLGHLPLINQPKQGEVLYIYLLVFGMTVNSILIREGGGVQMPVYYTNRAFKGAEARYPKAEKMTFSLVVMARRRRPYF